MTQATPATPPPPLVTFHRLIEDGRPPERADRSALGTLPTRAYRHCEAVAAASGFGWYLFPPTTLSLLWDGSAGQILWTCAALGGVWLALDDAAQFLGFAARFDAAAPPEVRGFSPPLPDCAARARHRANLVRPDRPHRPGLEPADPPAR
jgi:hypothetical protein